MPSPLRPSPAAVTAGWAGSAAWRAASTERSGRIHGTVDAALELAVERKRRPISKWQNLRHEHSGDAASSDRCSNRC